MNNTQKLNQMLEIQDQLNQKLHPNWRSQNWDFALAMKVEAAELADHLGYKWWKPKEPDWAQAQMEVVDIWHFMLSWVLVEKSQAFAHTVMEQHEFVTDPNPRKAIGATHDLLNCFETWSAIKSLVKIMKYTNLTFDDVYKLYIGKVALNTFRWESDYAGNYQKTWAGREDNEHLTEILNSWDETEFTVNAVVSKLASRYEKLVN